MRTTKATFAHRFTLTAAAAALLLLAASTALAQTQTVRVSTEVSNPRPVNGETVQVTVTVSNQLTQPITNVGLSVKVANGLIVGTSIPRCNTLYTNGMSCPWINLAAGQSSMLRLDVRVSNSAAFATIVATVDTFTTNGPLPVPPPISDRTSTLNLTIVRAPDEGDLKLRLSEAPSPVPTGSPVELQTTVTNSGPAMARDVVVVEPRIAVETQLDPRCTVVDFRYICRAESLLPGESTTFRNIIPAISSPTQIERRASVTADRLFDPDGADNSVSRLVAVGVPAVLARVLLPIVTFSTPGALGSQWRTDFSIFVDSDVRTYFFPLSFECRVLCVTPSLTGQFAPLRETWQPPLQTGRPNPGYLLRFDAGPAPEVNFSYRVRDLSRDAQDLGTELPVVRDSDLFTSRLHLLDIPFDARFRHTLRIYDPDASGTATVRVRVYGLSPLKDLLLDEVVTLSTAERLNPAFNLNLPIHPGFVQYDLGSKIPRLTDYRTGRVEIEPLTSGLRYWAFLSITNNTTQRVTLVTPQRAEREK